MLPASIEVVNGHARVYVSAGHRPNRLTIQEQAAELEKIRQTTEEARDAICVIGEQSLRCCRCPDYLLGAWFWVGPRLIQIQASRIWVRWVESV